MHIRLAKAILGQCLTFVRLKVVQVDSQVGSIKMSGSSFKGKMKGLCAAFTQQPIYGCAKEGAL